MKYICLSLLLLPTLLLAQSPAQPDTLVARKTDSVLVVSAKPLIRTLIDKTVMSVEGRPALSGQHALDLLKSAPGVVVDANENILMHGGMGVTVMIDGRNTQLAGQDLAQFLKSIEADNIKEIELISNPAAKYDAAGNAGIINIRLKKSMTNGTNGNITTSYSQSTHARGSFTGGLNMRNGKWNLYANGGMNKGLQYTIANNDRITASKTYTQRGIEEDAFHGANIRTGVDYSLNAKNTIGVLWMYNERYSGMDNSNNTILQQPGAADTNVLSRSIAPFNNNRNNINLNYHYSNGKGRELNIDGDYISFHSGLYNTVTTTSDDALNHVFGATTSVNDAAVAIQIKSMKADYTMNAGKNGKLEIGSKLVATETGNHLQVNNLLNNTWIQDTGRTNHFSFNESILAGYISYQKNWKQWSIQAGVRAEESKVKGLSEDLKGARLAKPDTNYLNLFPTLYVQYRINEKHQLGFNYGRRIDRPSYQDQNPFIYVLDAFNSEQGNPYLLPQFSNSIELSYVYKNNTKLELKYTYTSNFIEQLTYQSDTHTINTPQNSGNRKWLNINLSTSASLKKWWNVYAYVEPFYQHFDVLLNGYGLVETINHGSWGCNGYLNNSFSLGSWKAELGGWYNYQNTTTIYRSKPIGSANLAVSRKIMKGKTTVKLGITDLFKTQRWEETAQTANLNLHTYRKWEGANVNFGISYRFGNTKIKSSRERNAAAEEEINRIK